MLNSKLIRLISANEGIEMWHPCKIFLEIMTGQKDAGKSFHHYYSSTLENFAK